MIAILSAPLPPEAPAGAKALCAEQDGACVGTVLYRSQGETLELLDARADTPALLDGLVRAALQRGRTAGCAQAVCSAGSLVPALLAMGFAPAGTGARVAIEGFFGRGCHGASV